MTALTADRQETPTVDGKEYDYPMAAATEIFAGSLVVLDAIGNAEPATDAVSKVAVGRSEEYVNNTGAAAAKTIKVRTGIFRWVNSGTNTLTKANIGDTVYIVDDQTVDSSSTTSSPAGIMVDIDSTGVWVKTVPPVTLVSGLTAANNLSDVGTAATAATNLGLGAGDAVAHLDLTLAGDLVVDLTSTLTGAVACGAALAAVGAITGLQLYQTKTGTYTVQDAVDGDCTIEDLTDGAVITLPNCASTNKGQKVTLINTAASAAASVAFSPDASDKIVGGIQAVDVTGVANKDIINTKGTAIKGDYATLQSDGVDTWYVIGGFGVWAGE